ncbi:FAD-dependent oxidoreductase [Limisphaera sp. 4302-co]|uniref:FAD-dependent oxidoreductase n=1 Tax=Limisphaera sp. 4302-co TaxID=3400417 RepID=UPI003C19993F
MSARRILIVGGVAGGASAAARIRRLDERARIVMFERGPYVSFANCGLPYYVGGEISRREDLLLHTPESLWDRFRIEARVRTEVVEVDRSARTVRVRDLAAGTESLEPYDALLLAPGSVPVRPPLPGWERPGHFVVRNVPDVDEIRSWIGAHAARRAVVVGGGYIGLEMTEQLHLRGLEVSLVEALPQVMAPLDPEMAGWLHRELRARGVDLHLGDPVVAFEEPGPGEAAAASVVRLRSGFRLPADVVILALGVRPEVTLARQAGLELGELGGIRVDDHLRTSDPHIWAVGDAIEVRDRVTGRWTLLPLAGPANRQGRVAADNICGRPSRYEGSWGTAILRLFGLVAGCTGVNERTLRRLGLPFEAVHLHPGSHAGYYPGAEPVALKVLFHPGTGRLWGAQVVGRDGVDKRVDVLATALQAGLTVDALADLELAYAPPFGSAKDPVNLAGMVGQNVRSGLVRPAQWHEVERLDPARALVVDVRSAEERRQGFIPGSVHIPLSQLRERLGELPRDREIIVACASGQRSYFAARILEQHGFRVRNLTGSYRTWSAARETPGAATWLMGGTGGRSPARG